MEAYCFKCRTKREIRGPENVRLKNGRPATQGTCPVCGTKVFRIGKGKRHRFCGQHMDAHFERGDRYLRPDMGQGGNDNQVQLLALEHAPVVRVDGRPCLPPFGECVRERDCPALVTVAQRRYRDLCAVDEVGQVGIAGPVAATDDAQAQGLLRSVLCVLGCRHSVIYTPSRGARRVHRSRRASFIYLQGAGPAANSRPGRLECRPPSVKAKDLLHG